MNLMEPGHDGNPPHRAAPVGAKKCLSSPGDGSSGKGVSRSGEDEIEKGLSQSVPLA